MRNYSGHGNEGENYEGSLNTKDIAKIIKKELKKFKDTKWSVTTTYNTIKIALMEAPFEPTKDGRTDLPVNPYLDNMLRDKNLTDDAKRVFEIAIKIARSYNYNDSDAQIDYFDTNFHLNTCIGKWNKPFKLVEGDDYEESKNIWKIS